MIEKKHTAVVLGLFETGLGVARSLGQEGIKVYGIDHKKDMAWYSKYVHGKICPHPLADSEGFINFLIDFSKNQEYPPVLFITADEFLKTVSEYRKKLENHYLFNLPSQEMLGKISDKYAQYQLLASHAVNVPKTITINHIDELSQINGQLSFPFFVKASDVTQWRKHISGVTKGFVINNLQDVEEKIRPVLEKNIGCIAQELVAGPDTNHFKYCVYYSVKSKPLAAFTLKKIRQNPVRFGVGSIVESIYDNELMKNGMQLFNSLNYQGVGSVEFKRDNKDGKLKVIEINPRYWQQNSLTTTCGMNFPLINYLDLTGQNPEPVQNFEKGVKWVNIYMDFDSFLSYRRQGELTFTQWKRSLKGKKVFSDFSWQDIKPALYELRFGLKLLKAPLYLIKKIL